MSEEIKTIMEDEREISDITGIGDMWHSAGRFGVEKILPYHENGEMALHVWFAVYKDGKIWARVNSSHVADVMYKKIEIQS